MYENQTEVQSNAGLSRFFARVYGYMTLAVLISAVTAYLISINQEGVLTYFAQHPFAFWFIWIAQIVLVFVLAGKGMQNPTLAISGFIAYSMLMGVTLGITLLMYTSSTIAMAFVASGATFASMAIYGSVTKKDLSGWGQALFGALMGIIVAMLLNVFFLHSNGVEMLISFIMVVVFAGLTAYDHQKMKQYYIKYGESSSLSGIAIFCALQLYLDFVNLFLAFLRIFGNKQ